MKKLLLVTMVVFCQQVLADTNDNKARALGFDGYSWLATLASDYKQMGGGKLKRRMILVDSDCGGHFRAVQRIGEYVLFTPSDLRNSACSGREKVIVIPAKGVTFRRGDFIDENSYYVFAGILKGESMDGFPLQVLAVKQVKR